MKISAEGIQSKRDYLEDRRGYYVQGFSTFISNATDHDIKSATVYGLQLISDYTKLFPQFIYLIKKKKNEELSYTVDVYYVYFGRRVIGKLYISVQRLVKQNNLIIKYRYKGKGKEFKRAYGIATRRRSLHNASARKNNARMWQSNELLSKYKQN